MGKKWYIVHTYSGFEEKVKAAIEEKVKLKRIEDKISRILIPSEKIMQVKGKKKKEIDKKFYPGYVLVEMDLDDETWHLIKSINRVTGFVGGTKPVELPQEEVEVILQQIEKGPMVTIKSQFEKGDNVKITDGPFTNFVGYVDEVDKEHERLRVMVSIFGRHTPVELSFSQAEKI